jgi:uncharacterized membrane protein YkgB
VVRRPEVLPRPESGRNPGRKTIETLSLQTISASTAVFILAIWECVIGIGLLTGRFMRLTLLLLFVQMLGTLTPLLLFPQETWLVFPIAPTLEGQYIIKNAVLIAGAVVLGATVARWPDHDRAGSGRGGEPHR